MMKNTWPGGTRSALTQDDHASWNQRKYPGTRQLCSACEEPTGRCEEDTISGKDGSPLCEECRTEESPDE